jgi:hypothetical protein
MNNTNVSYSINSLKKEDISSILEALLFASSVDVCANWYNDNALSFLELAKKIRTYFPEAILENVYIYDHENKENFNDEHSKEIIQFFPEIKKEKIKE